MGFSMVRSTNNKRDLPFLCTEAEFDAVLNDGRVAMLVGEVRRVQARMDACVAGSEEWKALDAEKRKAKNKLPIFCFHAELDGSRDNEHARASGLSSIDVDHVSALPVENGEEGRMTAKGLYERCLMGREDELGIALVHVSCSGDGLRIVFVKPDGMSVPGSQEWFFEQTGIDKDDCIKDLARASYVATKDDVLYIDRERLFNTPVPGEDDAANVYNRTGTGTKTGTKTETGTETETNNVVLPVPYNKNLKIDGVAIESVAERYWMKLREQGVIKGAVPVEGERHAALMHFARDLAPYVGMDVERLMSALPRLKDDEMEFLGIARDSVEFLLEKGLTKKSRVIADIVSEVKGYDSMRNAYQSLEECVAFEESLPKMPKSLMLALKILKPGYRFPALVVLLALAMCLADKVLVKMGKFRPDRLRALLHLDGLSGSGKGVSYIPAEAVMATFRERNSRAMEERSEWKACAETEAEGKASHKKKKKEEKDMNRVFPDVRIMPRATTANGQLEVAQSGRTLLTLESELAGLVRQFKKSSYDRAPKLIPAFDGSEDGNLTQVGASVNRTALTNWVVITSGTRSALNMLIRHNGDVCDGLANRLAIALMPRDYSGEKLIAEYSEKDEAMLREVGEVLMQMFGELKTPKLNDAMVKWKVPFERETFDLQESLKRQLSGRVALIAFRFACAMQLYYEVDKVMKLDNGERDFDVSEAKESKWLAEWGTVFADYFLDKQFSIFGNAMIQQNSSSFSGLIVTKGSGWLGMMPNEFTYEDMEKCLSCSPTTFKMKVARAKKSGLIESVQNNGKYARFRKIE